MKHECKPLDASILHHNRCCCLKNEMGELHIYNYGTVNFISEAQNTTNFVKYLVALAQLIDLPE